MFSRLCDNLHDTEQSKAAFLTAISTISAAQPTLRPGNLSKQPDRITVDCRPDRVVFGEAPSKVMVFVTVYGDVELLSKNPAATLTMRNGRELVVKAEIAPSRLPDGLQYRFVFARSFLAHSAFEFMGADRRYKIDLVHWCRCDDVFSTRINLIRSEVSEGDTAQVVMEITALDDTKLVFDSSCQVKYRIRDKDGTIIASGPDSYCLQALSGIDFERGQSKELRIPIFTAWPTNGKEGEVTSLRPGKYRVECWVIGYSDLGLGSELALTVRKK